MKLHSGSARTDLPVGVLLIGSGFIAHQHIAAVDASPGAILAGVVDIDPRRAAAAAKQSGGVRWTTDLIEALDWPGVDACILCTPNDTHADLGRRIARAGKHLLVEKPLATTVEDAYDLVRVFHASKRVLFAAHTHRRYDYARSVKASLDSEGIGRPVFVRLAILGGWIWPDWRSWMIDAEHSGGHSLHNGVHLLDLVTWWMGQRPESIYARGQRQTAASLEIFDYLEMVARFPDGATAICEMSRGHRPASTSHRDVLVVGTDGHLALPWDGDAAILVGEQGITALPAAAFDGFVRQLVAFVDAIGGADSDMTPDDGAFAVAMGVAAERSMMTGEEVVIGDLLEGVR